VLAVLRPTFDKKSSSSHNIGCCSHNNDEFSRNNSSLGGRRMNGEDDFDEAEFLERIRAVSRAFTPSAPITDRDLFAGRQSQLQTLIVVDAQPGQHAVVYGVRGAGKTSLARVAQSIIGSSVNPYHICGSSDTFESIWVAIMQSIHITQSKAGLGFNAVNTFTTVNARSLLPEQDITAHAVAEALRLITQSAPLTIVIDEFDRPTDENVRIETADTIKILADRAVPVTVILVGVADAIGELLKEHESIQRSLIQVEMPPMTASELRDVVARGMAAAGLSATEQFTSEVVALSQGLPHYTHLLCFHAATNAVECLHTKVDLQALHAALGRALEDASQTVRQRYHSATFSNRPTLYKSVILACAKCPTDEVGSFGAPDIREQLRAITGINYEIPAFAAHLKDFSSDGPRGGVLKRIGTTRRFRYQFRDPLMPTYVLMRGRLDGLDHAEPAACAGGESAS
jgi:Cdc6-like AAA superfamily ATPase